MYKNIKSRINKLYKLICNPPQVYVVISTINRYKFLIGNNKETLKENEYNQFKKKVINNPDTHFIELKAAEKSRNIL